MTINVIRGLNQIGGSIVEITSRQARVIFDVGIELNETFCVPQIEGVFQGNLRVDAVFVSHYHADHMGLAKSLLPTIDLYMGEKCYEIMNFVDDYLNRTKLGIVKFIQSGKKIIIKDMIITPYLCDHSAYDAYMFVIESDGRKILYTGDYRANGRKSYISLLEKLPKVDVLITEGTTLSREDGNNVLENELEELAVQKIMSHNPIFVMQSAMNIDRIVTVYKSAKRYNMLFLQDLYMAGITSVIGGTIPNPKTFSDVRVFLTDNNDERYKMLEMYGDRKIGRKQIVNQRFVMCIRPSMKRYLEKLADLMSFDDAILFYSMWDGYKEKTEIREFLNYMEQQGVHICTLHTSGHADAQTIDALINKTNPKVIIPIHTENAKWFKRYDCEVCLDGVCDF